MKENSNLLLQHTSFIVQHLEDFVSNTVKEKKLFRKMLKKKKESRGFFRLSYRESNDFTLFFARPNRGKVRNETGERERE